VSEIAITAEGLGKQYSLRGAHAAGRTLRDAITDAVREPFRRAFGRRRERSRESDRFWALRDVSFQIRRGEAVGIIGHNGAGKSTLLRILSRITHPTLGEAKVYGRIGALLEVGTGFHGELTGRENVYLAGSILGMRREEIRRQFDPIIEFAEVERFVDTPVKHYSTGMYLRLAFAVAAHLEPDILIVDEALAVGDAAFQRKCLGKMSSVAGSGRTVLLVTHNMGFITRLSNRALVLEHGRVTYFGEPSAAINEYLRAGGSAVDGDLRNHPNRPPGMTPTLIAAKIVDKAGRPRHVFATGEDLYLEVTYEGDDRVSLAGAAFDILTPAGTFVTRFETYMRDVPPYRIPQRGLLRFRVANLPLLEGDYVVNLGIGADPRHFYDCIPAALSFAVEKSDPHHTGFMLTREHGICAFDASYEAFPDSLPRPLPFDRRRVAERRSAGRASPPRRKRESAGWPAISRAREEPLREQGSPPPS